jgi:hypothetical protein
MRTKWKPLLGSVPKPSMLDACVCVSMCAPLRRSMPAGCGVRPCVSMCGRSRAKDPKKVQFGESAIPTPVYIQNANLQKSRIRSTPSLLPTRDLSAVAIPIHYSFVTLHYSFVTGSVEKVSRKRVAVPPAVVPLCACPLHPEFMLSRMGLVLESTLSQYAKRPRVTTDAHIS